MCSVSVRLQYDYVSGEIKTTAESQAGCCFCCGGGIGGAAVVVIVCAHASINAKNTTSPGHGSQ
jgi:hypothetical protein